MNKLRQILLGISLTLTLQSGAQNLVPNFDFESYSTCPNYVSQIAFVQPWSMPTEGTSDYFNSCADNMTFVSVPYNQFGNQLAHSGNGYAGFYAFYNGITPVTVVPDYLREYVQVKLNQPLVLGNYYNISFYLSLSDNSKYATDAIGLLFSTVVIKESDKYPIKRKPQITNEKGSYISEKSGWTKIEGCFLSDSAYQFISIGNFYDGANTGFQFVGGPYNEHYSYYYIDDVSVISLEVKKLPEDTVICSGNSVELNAGSGNVIWSTGAITPEISVNSTGVYWFTRTEGACVVSDTISLTFAEKPQVNLGNDTTVEICNNEFVLLEIASQPGYSYLWSTGNTLPFMNATAAGIYSVTVTNDVGCTTADEIRIYNSCDQKLFIPSAFSPNGDGVNDEFFVRAEEIVGYEIRIFNRWGRIVFESKNSQEKWNAAGEPAGVYIYLVKFSWPDNHENEVIRKGNITLLK